MPFPCTCITVANACATGVVIPGHWWESYERHRSVSHICAWPPAHTSDVEPEPHNRSMQTHIGEPEHEIQTDAWISTTLWHHAHCHEWLKCGWNSHRHWLLPASRHYAAWPAVCVVCCDASAGRPVDKPAGRHWTVTAAHAHRSQRMWLWRHTMMMFVVMTRANTTRDVTMTPLRQRLAEFWWVK